MKTNIALIGYMGTGKTIVGQALAEKLNMNLVEMEREAIRRTLQATGGHRAETAKRLGVSVRTLQRKIKQYQL